MKSIFLRHRSAAFSSRTEQHPSTCKEGNSFPSREARKRLEPMPSGQATTTRSRSRNMAFCSSTAPKCMAR
ncbi:hypothetical protein C4Q21_00590 [Faecalibacterium prausnitzii]|nr:hypothetical protein C4Q21_00590 [Faecalibacterium prausnitzii]